MTRNITILNMSAPEDFLKIIQKADSLVERDPRFKDALLDMDTRYTKKTKQNKLFSVKMRFYIGYYISNRLRELKKEETINAQKPESNNQ